MKLATYFPRDDVLNELLRFLRVRSSFYCYSELAEPWGFRISERASATFHLVTRGGCWLEVQDGDQPRWLASGDLVILPHGHAHQLRDDLSRHVVPLEELVSSRAGADARYLRHDGLDECTALLCGGFTIEDRDALPVLAALPVVIHIQREDGEPDPWLENIAALLRHEITTLHPGAEAVITRLMDVLLTQTIRRYRTDLEGFRMSNFGARKDPQIAAALQLIHQQPGYAWTAKALAARVAMSRSAFASRFLQLVGVSPMRYLTRYRLARAADRLRTSGEALHDIARQTGYGSDVALSKAFKRHFGLPPGAYRTAAEPPSLPTREPHLRTP